MKTRLRIKWNLKKCRERKKNKGCNEMESNSGTYVVCPRKSSPNGTKITVLVSQLMQHDIAIIRRKRTTNQQINKRNCMNERTNERASEWRKNVIASDLLKFKRIKSIFDFVESFIMCSCTVWVWQCSTRSLSHKFRRFLYLVAQALWPKRFAPSPNAWHYVWLAQTSTHSHKYKETRVQWNGIARIVCGSKPKMGESDEE